MENFSEYPDVQSSAKILLASNVLRCANRNNNNNNLTKIGDKSRKNEDIEKTEAEPPWSCSCIEDEGGGGRATQKLAVNIDENGKIFEKDDVACNTIENNYALYDAGEAYDSDEAAAIDFHSNRNSRNNSTDNLSFASDQFYAKDLIFLEDDYDDDNGAEVDDISLNSDDCVYAYRGDGADFDFPLEAVTGRTVGIVGSSMDDEMDFLEMDFDPDTLSEIENGGHSINSDGATEVTADALLMQRDLSQLDGRHSSSSRMLNLHIRDSEKSVQQQQQQRQHFSSPIDDLSTVQTKAIQSHTLLGKNFGRMSLHLDQIQGSSADCIQTTKPLGCEVAFERVNGLDNVSNGDTISAISSSVGANQTSDVVDFPSTSAHSLPNTLHAFGRESKDVTIINTKTSPSKITGAKPKRLSTFSTSSSTSSKNSCKSRTSLRSVIGPSLYNSASFDERSVSCTEFRSVPPVSSVAEPSNALTNSANVLASNQLDLNDDSSCLDCLEKEFLASTIGKALEPNNCSKCRRKRYGFSKLDSQQQNQSSIRCRSGSPSFFTDIASDSFYELQHENWIGLSSLSLLPGRRQDVCMPLMPVNSTVFKCDIISGERLLENLLTDKETVTISMAEISEEIIKRSLDQLKVTFNEDLLKFYFEHLCQPKMSTNLINNTAMPFKISTEFKNLKQFLLYESKKNCNHPKLKCLIEHITKQQVEVHFKEDNTKTELEMVNVNASDILSYWSRNNDISNLKELDKRFQRANVIGKIANLIRQTQTKRLSMRTQIEYIAIPNYYPNGFLILKKKSQK